MSLPRLYRPVPLLLALAVVAACARPSHETADAAAEPSFDDASAAAEVSAGAPRQRTEAGPAVTDAAPSAAQMVSAAASQDDPARRFIRTARADFGVEDVYRSALVIEDLAAAQGGFVVANRIRSETQRVQRRPMGEGKQLELTEYVTRGELIVRVPSDRAQALLRELVAQMTFLDSRDFDAHDAQFDLLRQQLAFQRAQELQQSLGQAVQGGDRLDRKADVFEARAQALAARDEARVAQREFDDRIAFATISLSLRQSPQVRRAELVDTEAVFEQHGPGFFARLGAALGAGWHGLLQALVVLAAAWPLWLAGTGVWLGLRGWRRARRRVPREER